MKGGGAATGPTQAPTPWSALQYVIHERAGPFGRRFEIRDVEGGLVAQARMKKSEANLVLVGPDESTEVMRLEPLTVRLFQRAYDVVEAPSSKRLGQVRKREYPSAEKPEWFLYGPEGDQVGLITESERTPSLLRRVVPMERLASRAWALHWGQSIAGTIQPEPGLMEERLIVDFALDTKGEVDRRLALGALIAMRAEPGGEEPPKAPAS